MTSSNTKPRWLPVAAIALGMVATTAYLWAQRDDGDAVRSLTTPSSAGERVALTVEDTRAGEEDLAPALAEMNDKVAALTAQIASIKREALLGAMRGSPSEAGAREGAEASRLSLEEETQRGEAQAQAQEDLIQKAVLTEQLDPSWAPAAETAIRRVFEEKQIESLRLVDAECRASLCRIEIAANEAGVDSAGFDQSFRKLLIHRPWQGQGFGRIYNPFGPSPTAVLFLAREGRDLPQPN
jgi:hypothetical protein